MRRPGYSYRPTAPSKRAVRNAMAAAKALYAPEIHGAGVEVEEASTREGKRGAQPEGQTNKAIAQWKTLKNGLFLARNKRRLATPVGWNTAIMLGWEVDGSADWIGWQSVVITPDMVNKRVAVFVGIEAKRPDGGVVSKDQEAFLNRLRDDGGIAGVARSAQDAEDALVRWGKR